MSKRVFITGIDGYIGWSLAVHLVQKGYTVGGIDNLSRRKMVSEVGGCSATPIKKFGQRLFWNGSTMLQDYSNGNVRDAKVYSSIYNKLQEFQPHTIVYLGQQPSAPYSMIDAEHAVYTQTNNVMGMLNTLFAMKSVCPEAHLVKLGTMGEYGTPNIPIPEGCFPNDSWWFTGKSRYGLLKSSDDSPLSRKGPLSGMMFPRQAGSWYHQSKVHDTHNIEMACRIWGLRCTDIMQGVVYGTRISDDPLPKGLETRFDFDEYFGTVINRFCAQATIGIPLTVYGKGGQTRGFLPLRDSIQCLNLIIDNPPELGTYETYNQLEETYSVKELANIVADVAFYKAPTVSIQHIENPRVESEEHTYRVEHQKLMDLGYKPTNDIEGEISRILEDLAPHRNRIESCKDVILPKTKWR